MFKRNNISWIEKLSVRHFLMALWLTPIIVLGLVIGSYTINSFVNHITSILATNRLNTLDYLSRNAEFSLFSGNTPVLTDIANSVRSEGIKGVLFLSDNFNIIAHSSNLKDVYRLIPDNLSEFQSRTVLDTGRTSIIYNPVISEGIQTFNDDDNDKILGYTVLLVSENYVQNIRRELLTTSFLLLIFSIILLVILLLYLSKKIDAHVSNIMQALEDIGQGKYEQHRDLKFPWQLKKLYASINTLAAELTEYRGSMDSKVTAATEELNITLHKLEEKNRDLESARKSAETANTAKDFFLARMSHELRTPVNALIGFSKLAANENQTEKLVEYNEIIQHSSEHLLTLIEDLMDLSIIEMDKIRINKTGFSVHKLIEEIKYFHSSKLLINNLRLVTNIDDGIYEYIHTDRTRLLQILNNLVSNSIKFTQNGEISVLLSLVSDSELHQTVRFAVKDTGRGIKQENLESIFNSFVQLEKNVNPSQGSGLGLAIVKQLVNALGGEISVESIESEGSRFSFILELGKANQEETSPDKAVPEHTLNQALAEKTVLIAEDHDYSRLLLIEFLARYGMKTIESRTVDELLELATETRPDVFLIDIHLSGQSGIELARRLKSPDCLVKNVPVILMTADVTLNVQQVCEDSNADDMIYKPVDFAILLHKIAVHTDGVNPDSNISIPEFEDLVNEEELKNEINYLIGKLITAARDKNLDLLREFRHKLDGIIQLVREAGLSKALQQARDIRLNEIEEITQTYSIIRETYLTK